MGFEKGKREGELEPKTEKKLRAEEVLPFFRMPKLISLNNRIFAQFSIFIYLVTSDSKFSNYLFYLKKEIYYFHHWDSKIILPNNGTPLQLHCLLSFPCLCLMFNQGMEEIQSSPKASTISFKATCYWKHAPFGRFPTPSRSKKIS